MTDARPSSAIDPVRQPHWAPAPETLWCRHGDITFLLSLETGKYHTLDEVGGAAWHYMCDGDALDTVARRVAEDYGGSVSADEVLSDICQLLSDLSLRGLIVPVASAGAAASTPASTASSQAVAPRRGDRLQDADALSSDAGWAAGPPLPSVSACLLRLLMVHVSLRTIGLRRLLRRLARVTPGPLRQPTSSFVAALAGRVGTAMVWYPFGAACLEHSVCLLWMMRRAGCDADLRFGVHPFPFAAHAWVECQGEPVNESPERVALFKPFPAITLDSL